MLYVFFYGISECVLVGVHTGMMKNKVYWLNGLGSECKEYKKEYC